MKNKMMILMSVFAVIILGVAIMSVAGGNNTPNTNAPAVNNAPQANGYSCCGGPVYQGGNAPNGNYGNNGYRGGGRGDVLWKRRNVRRMVLSGTLAAECSSGHSTARQVVF